MGEFPKIVRQRLEAQAKPEAHPDADLLAAFAERSLGGPQREQMLGHLARCADCRQALALAFPACEPEELVAAAVPRWKDAQDVEHARAWHEWAVFRWGGLAAVLTIILIAVFLARPNRSMREAAAPFTATQAGEAGLAAQKEEAQKLEPATKKIPAPPLAKKQARAASNRPQDRLAARAEDKQEQGAVAGAAGGAAPAGVAKSAPAAHADTFITNETVEAQAQAPATARAANDQAPKSAGPPDGSYNSAQMVAGAKAKDRAFIKARKDAASPAAPRAVAATSRWSISIAGTLQRSDDGGRTWHDVPLDEGTKFRFVTAVGPDIWAGGSGGALFHSADGGGHWTRVDIRIGDRFLSGDLARIEVRDASRVEVFTTAGEKWATADGGVTWNKM